MTERTVPAARCSGTSHARVFALAVRNQFSPAAAATNGIPRPRAYVAKRSVPCVIVDSRPE